METLMAWVMKILGSATEALPAPVYLQSYDLEARGGIGEAKLTHHLDKALRFGSAGEVLATWKQRSKTMPNRPYGDHGPNRPLTAYTISPERVPESGEEKK